MCNMHTLLLDQSLLSVGVTFQRAVAANVADRQAEPLEITADKNGAMAGQRIFLRAHQCDAIPLCPDDHPPHTLPKIWAFCDEFIVRLVIHVDFRLRPARSQFSSEKQVLNASMAEGGFEILVEELRKPPAHRLGPDIRDDLNIVLCKHSDELIDRH